MVDTVRTRAALQTLLADNTSGDISPQDARDVLVSTYPLAQTWAPTWTNVTVGNAVINARYWQWGTGTGSKVEGQLEFEFGNTSAISGVPIFSLPVATRAYTLGAGETRLGDVTISDVGTAFFDGMTTWQSTTTAAVRSKDLSGSLVKAGVVNGTSPMTWVAGDSFSALFAYEAG